MYYLYYIKIKAAEVWIFMFYTFLLINEQMKSNNEDILSIFRKYKNGREIINKNL